MSTYDFETCAVRSGLCTDTQYGAVVPPLHLSTNFTFDGLGGKRQYDYTRSGNPTRDLLAVALAELEGAAGAVITSSGMSALTLVTSLVGVGETVFAPHDCYGGTFRMLTALAKKGILEVVFLDFADLAGVELAFSSHRGRLALVETPSNPLLRVVDLAAIGQLCQKHQVYFAVDNTFLSPALQRPIAFGADLVVHSTTKYLNGHGDVVGGAVAARTPELAETLSWWANCLGLTGSPFDSYLTLRGIRTLAPRMRAHLENANAIVDVLCTHPAVSAVYYPGLKSHPGHAIAARQQSGFGAIVSFELCGGDAQVATFVRRLKHFSLAESLGGVESLVAHPATMTHAAMAPEARARAGINDSLLRLSVGIESENDLVADLRNALDSVLNSQWQRGAELTSAGLLA